MPKRPATPTRIVAAGNRAMRVLPGFHLTLGITIAMLSTIVLIPLASVFGYAFTLTPEKFVEVITAPATRSAFATSIGCSLVAALINVVF